MHIQLFTTTSVGHIFILVSTLQNVRMNGSSCPIIMKIGTGQ